ncbi:hypothetical protein ACP1_0033 [Aeromonas phage ACP1]
MIMINEKTIANALALSISQVEYKDDPRLYLYEVNQVLNRYKTNLYKLMDESKSNIDPATVIQFVLRSSVDISGQGNVVNLVRKNSTMLKVYGTRAYGPEVYVEYEPFQCAIDITDKFHSEALAQIRDDLFLRETRNEKCNNAMLEHPNILESRMSIGFQLIKSGHTDGCLSILMSGIIYPEELEKGRMRCPMQFDPGEPKRNQKQRKPDAYYLTA